MQAVTGLERAVGGVGNDPLAPTWIPIDMAGGWVTAVGILAGLYAPRPSGQGQQVATSLLGAGMLLQSGVFQRDGECVRGPELDARADGVRPRLPHLRVQRRRAGSRSCCPTSRRGRDCARCPKPASLPATYAPLRGGRSTTRRARGGARARAGVRDRRRRPSGSARLQQRQVPVERIDRRRATSSARASSTIR